MIPSLRIARRFIRKLTKPFALYRNDHQMAVSEQTVRCLEESHAEVIRLLREENYRQADLMAERRQIANW